MSTMKKVQNENETQIEKFAGNCAKTNKKSGFLKFRFFPFMSRIQGGHPNNYKYSPLQNSLNSLFSKVPWLYVYVGFTVIIEIIEQLLNFRQLKKYNMIIHALKLESEDSLLISKFYPPEIQQIVTKENYLKNTQYNRDKLIFGIYSSIFFHLFNVITVLFFLGPFLWNLSGTLLKNTSNEYLQSLLFLGLNMIIGELTNIPFNLYFDFVLEEKYNFNKKTYFLFMKDKVISILLQMVIGPPIICSMIYLVKAGGKHFYIYLWFFTVFASLTMMMIYPNLIAPLFNKFQPLKDEELRTKIETLASSLKFPLKKLYEIDGSKRSAHSNAYFYGLWFSKQIVLFDTLLNLSHDKILAILGHELGHWKLNHSLKMIIASFFQIFVVFFLYHLVFDNDALYNSFGYYNQKPVIVGLLLFFNIFQPVNAVLDLLMTYISRIHEFQADAFASKLGLNESLQAGLIEIHESNKATLDPDEWYSWYHYSHPPLLERLSALRRLNNVNETKKDL